MNDLNIQVLRDAYNHQLRPEVPNPVPDGVTVERDGPLVRIRGLGHGGFLSRPVLQRLGFVTVTTTTPYVYTP
ncbi:MAG TPA: hypothetical protein VFX60_04640 [Micromonospora sp.]|nr:hypothetical protein [Micromonospora sp.]